MSQSIDKSLIIDSEQYGTVPKHLNLKKNSTFQWRIYVEKPMNLNVDVSYSYQGESNKNRITVEAADIEITRQVLPTGRVVGEPNSDWHIDSFNSHRIGEINISQPGYYDISLKIEPDKGESVDFQWVWLDIH
jgi:alpha-L-fucosidase